MGACRSVEIESNFEYNRNVIENQVIINPIDENFIIEYDNHDSMIRCINNDEGLLKILKCNSNTNLILSYLTLPDVIECLKCSKSISILIFWNYLRLANINIIINNNNIIKYYMNVKKYNLYCLSMYSLYNRLKLFNNYNHIKHMIIDDNKINKEDLRTILPYLSVISQITINRLDITLKIDKRLYISTNKLLAKMTSMNHLLHLTLGSFGNISEANDREIKTILSNIGKPLLSLNLIKLVNITTETFYIISYNCPSIQHFSCIGCNNIRFQINSLETNRYHDFNNFLNTLGKQLVTVDLRYTIDCCDYILQQLMNYLSINTLKLFYGSRLVTYNHGNLLNEINDLVYIKTHKTWNMFVNCFNQAYLLMIDDIFNELLIESTVVSNNHLFTNITDTIKYQDLLEEVSNIPIPVHRFKKYFNSTLVNPTTIIDSHLGSPLSISPDDQNIFCYKQCCNRYIMSLLTCCITD